MHALWCCGPRRSRDSAGNKISFTSIFRASNTPAVNTSNTPGTKTKCKDGRPSEQISPFEGPVELCQLAGATEHADTGSFIPSTRRSTFEGVKAKIIQHLSQDSGPGRHSRVSIGHSDEELARRAEVRRLRQKRIQDELNKDDDDDGQSNGSHESARYLSTLIDMGSPCSGPRDTLEFTFNDCALASHPTSSDLSSDHYIPTSQDSCQQAADSRATGGNNNCDNSLDTQSNADGFVCQSRPIRGPLPERRCVSMISVSPRPSSCQPGSPRLDRIIGLDNEFNIRHGSHAWDDQSTLGIWLIAQGMKPANNTSLQPEHAPNNTSPSQFNVCLPNEEPGGVDSILESSFSILDRVNTADSLVPAHTEETCEGSIHPISVISDQPGLIQLPRSETNTRLSIKSQHSKQLANNGSSCYPSGLPSFDPSPSGSESHGYVLSQRDLENLELSPVHWCGNLSTWKDLEHSEGQSSYTTAEEQPFPQPPEDTNAPELRKGHICNSRQTMDVVAYPKKASTQESSPRPDQNAINGQCQGGSESQPMSTHSRVSFKEKLQHSLSHISKLGSSSSNKSFKFAGISKPDGVDQAPVVDGKGRHNIINWTSCDIAETTQTNKPSAESERQISAAKSID
ncbi:hypothetical protein NOR_03054 [Metarhizium rileyi]|uniref:Uncharacterized protein n=1 Tax=Metarhizium rileyi (strain RCEF 4871) TaxID=1649241 RepID=A0A167G8V1_METRR|nr:hypothetical protein NOR_03054 [Metarhizium rileyi RCEF 4871]